MAGKEPTVSTGTTSQYYRGDKVFAQVNLINGVFNALPIANGGTGQITANNALNALLPSQSAKNTYIFTTNGTNTSWTNNYLTYDDTIPIGKLATAHSRGNSDTSHYVLNSYPNSVDTIIKVNYNNGIENGIISNNGFQNNIDTNYDDQNHINYNLGNQNEVIENHYIQTSISDNIGIGYEIGNNTGVGIYIKGIMIN